jgi:hypothetical protein
VSGGDVRRCFSEMPKCVALYGLLLNMAVSPREHTDDGCCVQCMEHAEEAILHNVT